MKNFPNSFTVTEEFTREEIYTVLFDRYPLEDAIEMSFNLVRHAVATRIDEQIFAFLKKDELNLITNLIK